ncbi:hypothetical protein CVT26_010738 [Gymnopilus dilepis]|uniref:Uncharacterized protein n=1 Tax=Gymnopilus dilepis TaxID=231916 RepID=A0A409Y0T8_9AGAR|nr:hypothetical protein CVT26_010738 [Gymnopilus dilepis]
MPYVNARRFDYRQPAVSLRKATRRRSQDQVTVSALLPSTPPSFNSAATVFRFRLGAFHFNYHIIMSLAITPVPPLRVLLLSSRPAPLPLRPPPPRNLKPALGRGPIHPSARLSVLGLRRTLNG